MAVRPRRSLKIPKKVRLQVWRKYMPEKYKEMIEGPCYVCNSIINILEFECGHVKSRAEGGNDRLENLRPICRSCNRDMGTENLYEFKRQYFGGQCKHILLKGSRKGKRCNRNIAYNSKYCSTHYNDMYMKKNRLK